MPKSTREIIIQKLEQGPQTQQSLMDHTCKSQRSIQRELKELRERGILVEEGKSFWIEKKDIGLSPAKLLEFGEIIQSVQQSGQVKDAAKLQGILETLQQKERTSQIEQLSDSPWFHDASGNLLKGQNHFKTIVRAINEKKSIKLDYEWINDKHRDEIKKGDGLDPIKVVLRAEHLYMIASPKKGATLTFRVDRIKSVSIKGDAREDYSDFDIKKFYKYVWGAWVPNLEDNVKPTKIKLVVKDEWFPRMLKERAFYPTPKVTEFEDKTTGEKRFRIEMEVYKTPEFDNWLEGMKRHCV